MRKFLIAAAVGSMVAGGALMLPAHAAVGPAPNPAGCATDLPSTGASGGPNGNIGGGAGQGGVSCTYVAAAASGSYLAATSNPWTIVSAHPSTNGVCSVGTLSADKASCIDGSASGNQGQVPLASAPTDETGSYNSVPGDKVTVTISDACVPGDPTGGQACGFAGAIAAGEVSAP
jgi:hypothetical protein